MRGRGAGATEKPCLKPPAGEIPTPAPGATRLCPFVAAVYLPVFSAWAAVPDRKTCGDATWVCLWGGGCVAEFCEAGDFGLGLKRGLRGAS